MPYFIAALIHLFRPFYAVLTTYSISPFTSKPPDIRVDATATHQCLTSCTARRLN